MSIEFRSQGAVAVVTIDRPDVANAIDRPTAAALADAFRRFEADESLQVAVLTGANGTFCAGADLKAMREPGMERASRLDRDGDGPVGPTRMLLEATRALHPRLSHRLQVGAGDGARESPRPRRRRSSRADPHAARQAGHCRG